MNIPDDIFDKLMADSMAFLAPQGHPPIFDLSKRPLLDLAHLTSVPPYISDFRSLIATHDAFKGEVLANPDVHLIEDKDDASAATCYMSTGILLGLQNTPNGSTRDRIQQLFDHGVRVMSLTYDHQNQYGCGFAAKTDTGLTEEGRNLIGWMAEIGMILDISHAGQRTTREVLKFLADRVMVGTPRLPVMASHSGCCSVHPHPRNLLDEDIARIALLGGYIGIPLITFFLCQPGCDYLDAFTQHMRRMITVCQDNRCVGIGSDCLHVDMTMEQARTNYERVTTMLTTDGRFGEYFPDRPPELILQGSRMFHRLNETLTQFPDCVLGENFRDFIEGSLS